MKKFLGSVGKGLLIGKVGGEPTVIATVNTLTESTLSFSSTMEEVRAGQGAKLYGRFNHDTGMTVTLTDAMFDMNYIALQVGSELQRGGIAMFTEELVATAENKLVLSKPVCEIGESCGLDKYLVWFREAGCGIEEKYNSVAVEAKATEVTMEGAIVAGHTYCVSYFTQEVTADTVLVNANFVPAELTLVLTTKLFAGDSNAVETGRPIGEITIKVPRFQLDGAFDLSMAMSSAATMSLNGTALAVDAGGCEDDGIYAEIVEVVTGKKWFTGLTALRIEGEMEEDGAYTFAKGDIKAGDIFDIYGVYANDAPIIIPAKLLDPDQGETGIVLNQVNGAVITPPSSAGTITVKLDEKAPENAGMPEEIKALKLTIQITE